MNPFFLLLIFILNFLFFSSGQTVEPTGQPSSWPSSQPTVEPSSQPTAAPTGGPSGQPSVGPSSQPTAAPSGKPTQRPSGQPSSWPSSQPTVEPSSQPTAVPTGVPSGQPSFQPTGAPSGKPTQRPSGQPSSWPSSQPTVEPSSQPTTAPTGEPSSQPSVTPTCQPSSHPTKVPTALPTAHPITHPSNEPSSQPSTQPSSFPRSKPSAQPISSPTSQPSAEPNSRPSSQPTVSPSRQPISNPTLIPTRQPTVASTPQLKAVIRQIILYSTVFESSVTSNEISVTLSSLPKDNITIQLNLVPLNATISTLSKIYPTSFSINSNLQLLSFDSTFYAGSSGLYEILLTVNGRSAREFNVSYAGSNTIQVISLNTAPPTPLLQSAIFSADGSLINIQFSAPTNQAGFGNSFPCWALFNFIGVNSSSCYWTDSSTINLVQPSTKQNHLLSVGSVILLKSLNNFKASCQHAITQTCNGWPSISGGSITVSAPRTALIPIVQISAPSQISPCHSLLLDLTASSGNAGRPFQTTILVNSLPVASNLRSLQLFLNQSYNFSPPSVIPSNLLQKGTSYQFYVVLCNFLTACGSKSIKVNVLLNETVIPYVTIVGTNSITMYKRYALQVLSNAYTMSCSGAVSYDGLIYSWSLFFLSSPTNITISVAGITSSSRNKAVYTLSAYTLIAPATYQLQLTVSSRSSTVSPSARITITVIQGSLVAVITGSPVRFVQANVVTLIDGSKSYDQDQQGVYGSQAGLNYQWSCVQQLPYFIANCSSSLSIVPLSLSSQTLSIFALNTVQFANTTLLVTMMVFDSTRSATASVQLKITRQILNSVSISTTQNLVTSVAPSSSISILSTIQVFVPCSAIWTVNDPLLNLTAISATQTEAYFPRGGGSVVPFNLKLYPNALPQRSTFIFMLSCGLGSAAITVTTNGPPVPGQYQVSPIVGIELTTNFLFSTNLWSDPDLPLTYQFGFLSPATMSNLVIQGRSGTTTATSTLPAGFDYNNNMINCSIEAFDAVNATFLLTSTVTVNPLSTAQRQQALINLLLSSTNVTGNINAQKSLVSLASTTLNHINCTVPFNCSSLNRAACSSTPNTCGGCMPGFEGDSGDKNSLCLAIQHFYNQTKLSGSCTTNNDCDNQLQTCVQGTCEFVSKECVAACSGQGTCAFKYISTGIPLDDCKVNDLSCEAYCICAAGFQGEACAINATNLPALQHARSILVRTLQNITEVDDINTQSVPSWASYLYSISINPDEIAAADLSTVNHIALSTVTAGQQLALEPTQLNGVLDAVDGVATVTATLQSNTSRVIGSATLVDVLNQYSSVITSQLVYGEKNQVNIYTNFRLNSVSALVEHNTTVEVSVPSNSVEEFLQLPKSSITITPTDNASYQQSTYSISLIQTYEKSYTHTPNQFYSDPVQIALRTPASSGVLNITRFTNNALASIQFNLVHNDALKNFINQTFYVQNITTLCLIGTQNTTVQSCKYGDYKITHHCNGSYEGYLVSRCPVVVPSCNHLNISSGNVFYNSKNINSASAGSCQTVNYTATATVCNCPISSPSMLSSIPLNQSIVSDMNSSINNTQQQGSSNNELLNSNGITDMVAATEYLTDDFVETFAYEGELNSSGASKAVIVIVLVSVMWGAGMVLLLFVQLRETPLAAYDFLPLSLLGLKSLKAAAKKGEGSLTSNHAVEEQGLVDENGVQKSTKRVLAQQIRQEILNYIELVMPAVYNVRETFLKRSFREIGLHHRYFNVLNIDQKRRSTLMYRIYRAVRILSIQTLTMFLQAVLFDLQRPSDDGSCVQHTTEESCLQRKTILDASQSYCSWTMGSHGRYTCGYATPDFSEIAVIYVMVITLIVTALFKVPLDFFLQVWISPVFEKNDRIAKETQIIPIDEEAGIPTKPQQEISPNNDEHNNSGYMTRFKLPYLGWHHLFAFSSKNRFIPDHIMQKHQETHQYLLQIKDYEQNQNLQTKNPNASSLSKLSHQLLHSRKTESEELIDKRSDQLCHGILSVELKLMAALEQQREKVQHTSQGIVPTSQMESAGFINPVSMETNELRKQEALLQLYCDQWGLRNNNPQLSADREIIENAIKSQQYHQLFDYHAMETFKKHFKNLKHSFERYERLITQANAAQSGLELMHLFMIDLLGQSTVSARIFRNKFDEDFQVMMVVSRLFQYISILLVFGLNGFFIYYMLLRSVEKGYDWQIQFLNVVLSQLAIEIFLFETIECISIHYLIPESVRVDVKKAISVLESIAENIETILMDDRIDHKNGRSLDDFDSSEMLFLSKSLVVLKPESIETYIIHAYRNHYPGMISHTWSHYLHRLRERRQSVVTDYQDNFHVPTQASAGSGRGRYTVYTTSQPNENQPTNGAATSGTVAAADRRVLRNRILQFILLSISDNIVYLLQFIGILPVFSQRIVIRGSQITILSGLTILWYFAEKQEQLYAIIAFIAAFIVCTIAIRARFNIKDSSTDVVLNERISDLSCKNEEELQHRTRNQNQNQNHNTNTNDIYSLQGNENNEDKGKIYNENNNDDENEESTNNAKRQEKNEIFHRNLVLPFDQ